MLQDFKWYKDMFLVKIMTRSDCSSHYWNENFVAGLPTLFAEKVRQRIRNLYNGRIPYESLAICIDLKLKGQMKKQNKDSRKELGKFCSYYGYDMLVALSKKNKYNTPRPYKAMSKSKFSKRNINKTQN